MIDVFAQGSVLSGCQIITGVVSMAFKKWILEKASRMPFRMNIAKVAHAAVATGRETENKGAEIRVMCSTKVCAEARFIKRRSGRERGTFNQANIKLSQSFINISFEGLDRAIETAMGIVAGYCGADRAVVYLYKEEGNAPPVRLYEWSGQFPGKEDWQNALRLPDYLPVEKAYVRQSAYLEIFPREGTEYGKRDFVCAYPLVMEHKIAGAAAFYAAGRHKEWQEEELSLIMIFGGIMSSMLVRKQQQSAYIESGYRNQIILDSIHEGVGLFDRKGNALQVNRHLAELFGRSEKDCIGVNIRQIPSGDACIDLLENRLKLLEGFFSQGKVSVSRTVSMVGGTIIDLTPFAEAGR
jgi:hypothetical protein